MGPITRLTIRPRYREAPRSERERAREREVPYPRLFESFELAGKRLRNRIVHASMSTGRAIGGRIGPGQIQYCANRAKGGAAVVITEPLAMIRQQQGVALRASVFTAESEEMLRRWARAVEDEDCRLLGQVQDSGRGRHLPLRNYTAIGASPLPDDLSWTMPHELTPGEIIALLDEFGASSARLKRCGFSGVEISAGHGHMFHQFMSPWSNIRTDRYGGDFDGRLRIMVELIDSLRSHCGDDFIIGLKLPGDDGVPGGIGPELSAQITNALTSQCAVDYVCFAQGSHARSLELHIPDGNTPRLTYMPLIRQLRESANGVPVMALGRITDPAEAEGILTRGDAELIGVGRALIADPAWPLKALQGRAREIRYCVSGNTCWFNAINHRPLVCDNNPRVAMPDEVDWKPAEATTRRRVTVVGAGVAGMEAAWVAAARGHEVTVFGRSDGIGGKTRLHALLPCGEGLSSVYDYQHQEAIREQVRFRLGIEAKLGDILATYPDEVVLATGATMLWPRCLPVSLRDSGLVPDLRDAAAQLLRYRERQPGTAVVFDMDHTEGTYAFVELLHARFDRVVVLTPRAMIAEDVALVTRQGIERRLHEKGIRVVPFAEPLWTDAMELNARLEVRNVLGGTHDPIDDVALFSYATPRSPNDSLYEALRAAGVPTRKVGDCEVAHAVQAATSTGHAAGLAV